MRIVTRPDFDGIVCAVMLYEAENITGGIKWVEPNELQSNKAEIMEGDIIANLPYNEKCSLWFDHHFTNQKGQSFTGLFRIAPSAAGLVYEYYRDKITNNFDELIRETDKIDSAALSLDEVMYPEKYPYVLLSMTITNRALADEAYWNILVGLLREKPIHEVMKHPDVKARCDKVVEDNKKYRETLKKHTTINRHITITDLRSFDEAPNGNRFLVYSMFPEASVSLKIRHDSPRKKKVVVSVGHSIFNRTCNVNVGAMLSKFNGGGHPGAGACTNPSEIAEDVISKIVSILLQNKEDS